MLFAAAVRLLRGLEIGDPTGRPLGTVKFDRCPAPRVAKFHTIPSSESVQLSPCGEVAAPEIISSNKRRMRAAVLTRLGERDDAFREGIGVCVVRKTLCGQASSQEIKGRGTGRPSPPKGLEERGREVAGFRDNTVPEVSWVVGMPIPKQPPRSEPAEQRENV